MARTRVTDQFMMLMIPFGIVGAFLGSAIPIERGGELGAIIGVAIAGFLSLSWWISPRRHRHKWESGVVYDHEGKERFMLKFCGCGEILFDGFFSRESNVGNLGEWINVDLKEVKEDGLGE